MSCGGHLSRLLQPVWDPKRVTDGFWDSRPKAFGIRPLIRWSSQPSVTLLPQPSVTLLPQPSVTLLPQVLFASDSSLGCPERRALLSDFLHATFDGWRDAGREPRAAAQAVMALMSKQTDHWAPSIEFHTDSVSRCYVRRSPLAPRCALCEHWPC